jgi:1-pyrroline-5-carboxylate dehydrogenase
MNDALLHPPFPANEPVLAYAPGSPERAAVVAELTRQRATLVRVPNVIGGREVHTDPNAATTIRLSPPHDHAHSLGTASRATRAHVEQAIAAALAAKRQWERLPFEHRAGIFLKAAELITTKYRAAFNAATMLAQSKTVHQSEIDAVCELADFLRFNVAYAAQLYAQQPGSSPGVWNRLDYRPLEGFVFAITPFNFTAIAGNLPSSAALMGNTVVWKPADSQIYSAHLTMQIFREAGLPDGVINLVMPEGAEAGEVIFAHPEFAGLHFTGSTAVFKALWKQIASNLDHYRSYPRIVGETGGKDFVLAHPSADVAACATALVRGAYEFNGQKCSAASRAYLPKSIAQPILDRVIADLKTIKQGPAEDLSNFVTAVIDERAFDKITGYIDRARKDPNLTILAGGGSDKTKGYFIEPTLILSQTPDSEPMREEIFGPVLTVYVYDDATWAETLTLVDRTSPYALTGAIFAQDRYAQVEAMDALRNAAGNLYLNDKPTGAVVNQQPFGGARGSGTNDKAGSILNLIRWTSPRTIKEVLVSPTDYRYPFLG